MTEAPADPAVRAFADALAEAIARMIVLELAGRAGVCGRDLEQEALR